MGTVCNVQTGQCQCQEGATGSRCDTCVPGFLRIPGHGCRRCDECALALNSELDDFDLSVALLQNTLGNVSSLALAGARVTRVEKALGQLDVSILKAWPMIFGGNEHDVLLYSNPNILT